jgi:drug/metabolite transporter (DMT)-like permease
VASLTQIDFLMATAPTGILYAATVLLWGCAFIAIANLQGVVALEMSIVYRDALCAILALGYALLRGQSLRFSRRDHLFLAAQGAFLFALNDVFIFNAVGYLTSGLVALVISLVMVMNVIFGALFLGFAIRPRVLLSAGLGIGGVALVFWSDLMAFDLSSDALIGLGLALCSPVVFSLGQIIVARNQLSDLPLMRSTGVAMGYGAITAFVMAMILGRDVTWSFDPAYVASFFYIALIGTLLGFFMYFTVLGRIGPGRAAYISVLTPVVALIVSTLFEGFVWTATSLAGAAIILAGNVLVLTGGPAAAMATPRVKSRTEPT